VKKIPLSGILRALHSISTPLLTTRPDIVSSISRSVLAWKLLNQNRSID